MNHHSPIVMCVAELNPSGAGAEFILISNEPELSGQYASNLFSGNGLIKTFRWQMLNASVWADWFPITCDKTTRTLDIA